LNLKEHVFRVILLLRLSVNFELKLKIMRVLNILNRNVVAQKQEVILGF